MTSTQNIPKTIHLLGVFSDSQKYSYLEDWATTIIKFGQSGDNIVLHLIASNTDSKRNLMETWDKFVHKYNELLKPFENKIYLHGLCGQNYLIDQDINKLAHYFYAIFDYKFIDKFDSGEHRALENYFYIKHKVFLAKILRELDEKWLHQTPDLPKDTEDPDFFSYSVDEHFLFMFLNQEDKLKRLELGRLKTDIPWMIGNHDDRWTAKNVLQQDWLPCYYYYTPQDKNGNNYHLPRIGINKNDSIYLINHTPTHFEKFIDIFQDIDKEFELNLEICTNFKT